ncbi:MAG: heme-binding protein [Paracoccaceae bacterium]|jgi:hypothetical protein|nr:heme-binding protein [Paracoccaceae bacterium]
MKAITLVALAAGVGMTGLAGAWAWSARSVETPDYRVVDADGAFELRRYAPTVIARVERPGDRGRAVRAAFGPLSRYIFARDRTGEKIAMTAPVTQEPAGTGWAVSFIMPAGRLVADLPRPAGDVNLLETKTRLVAAVRFSGRWTDARFDRFAGQLDEWARMRGFVPIGPPEFAYYNDPFTPGFLRRNEVLLALAE